MTKLTTITTSVTCCNSAIRRELSALISPSVVGPPLSPKASSRVVRARSMALVDPFVPTTIAATGRLCTRSVEMAAAGQTVAAMVDLLVTTLAPWDRP